MKQTEEHILQEITQLFADLEAATYGRERANGRFIPPNAKRFYYCAKRIYDTTDELVNNYQPNYVTVSDYGFICDSRRTVLRDIDVFKDRNKLEYDYLTCELDKYLQKIQELFGCILSYYRNTYVSK